MQSCQRLPDPLLFGYDHVNTSKTHRDRPNQLHLFCNSQIGSRQFAGIYRCLWLPFCIHEPVAFRTFGILTVCRLFHLRGTFASFAIWWQNSATCIQFDRCNLLDPYSIGSFRLGCLSVWAPALHASTNSLHNLRAYRRLFFRYLHRRYFIGY